MKQYEVQAIEILWLSLFSGKIYTNEYSI